MVHENCSSSSGTFYELSCLICGDDSVFDVIVSKSSKITALKKLVHEEGKNGILRNIDAKDLVLFKVNINIDEDSLPNLKFGKGDEGIHELKPWDSISDYWSEQPAGRRVHIFVKAPATLQDQRASKRARLYYNQPPQTPPSGKTQAVPNQNKDSPPRLRQNETEAAMVKAFEPFKEAMQRLATGELDGYLDSTMHGEFWKGVSTNPILLVHGLGNYAERERIKKLFACDTTHLFNTSGAGKTRLCLDGLCQHWGIYISCVGARKGLASGSLDFAAATEILLSMSTWNLGKDASALQKNAQAADRVFTMLLCARIFVLKQFLDLLPPGTDLATARRRWVLLQVMPACLRLPRKPSASDIFVTVLKGLRHADTEFMLDITRTMLDDCYTDDELFSDESTFFVVIDEAQVAADHLKDFFPSTTTGTDLRPILHELYRSFDNSRLFGGIIIAGTGLSIDMVEGSMHSLSAKNMGRSQITRVFTDTGRWSDKYSQDDYVRRHLKFSDTDSDRRLMDRIQYWFSGRYHVTASLIELLLHSEDVPRHRVLTAFAKHLTGFTILDATDLESKEGPISDELMTKMKGYEHLIQTDRLFRDPHGGNLIQCLVNVLIRWRIGSQATSIPIENHMHMLVWLGMGHLEIRAGDKFDADSNFPVYINEPLVVLSLSSIFQKCPWTTRIQWIQNSLGNARTRSSLGFISEELALYVLLEEFGGKFTALGKVFHFPLSSPLASRNVTLVSLKRNAYGTMQSCQVSWQTGCSDRFGFRAENPTDVLRFLQDPDGKPFLFPDNHMGPDLICFLQDQETMELVVVALQSKISPQVDAETWIKAVNSFTPEFFYTIVKDGQRGQYAPVSYPGLLNEVDVFWKTMLGPGVYQDVANVYRRKLCSSTRANEEAASLPQRKTPHFLCILASPDDEQQQCLQGSIGISAVLRWRNIWIND